MPHRLTPATCAGGESIKKDILLRNIQYFENETQRDLYEARRDAGRNTHICPSSTLVAAMGNHWHPGCFEAIKAMVSHTFEQGIRVALVEIQDACLQPYDAMGVMRNAAYMKALEEGWEYLLYCDNDVSPEPDTLMKLLQRPVPVVSPIIIYADGLDHGLTMPKMPRNKGLALVTSCVLSFLLFRTSVFLPWAMIPFWQDALGADESYHFQRLRMAGHYPWVDTDVVVTAMSAPHYPLDGVKRDAIRLALDRASDD